MYRHRWREGDGKGTSSQTKQYRYWQTQSQLTIKRWRMQFEIRKHAIGFYSRKSTDREIWGQLLLQIISWEGPKSSIYKGDSFLVAQTLSRGDDSNGYVHLHLRRNPPSSHFTFPTFSVQKLDELQEWETLLQQPGSGKRMVTSADSSSGRNPYALLRAVGVYHGCELIKDRWWLSWCFRHYLLQATALERPYMFVSPYMNRSEVRKRPPSDSFELGSSGSCRGSPFTFKEWPIDFRMSSTVFIFTGHPEASIT